MEDASPSRRPDRLSWAVFAVLAALYFYGRCPSYGAADSPRLVLDALTGGGTGPLSWLFHWAALLPGGTPEAWVNAVPGPFQAGAAALLFALLRRLGLERPAALAAAALAGTLHQSWYRGLVAGCAPFVSFGLALALWSVAAWKEEEHPWPLALGALGAALGIYAATRAPLGSAGQWLAALGAGLLFSRLDVSFPKAAAGALCGVILVAAARPYHMGSHNPTREWALAALDSARGGACVVTKDPTLAAALELEIRRAGSALTVSPDGCAVPFYDPLVPRDCAPVARGVLLEPCGAPAGESPAERAQEALEMPAFTAVGLRDRAKYSFSGEDVLYDRLAAVLRVHRDALPASETVLRRELDAQLADYAPR